MASVIVYRSDRIKIKKKHGAVFLQMNVTGELVKMNSKALVSNGIEFYIF